jgi:hypothetical protein
LDPDTAERPETEMKIDLLIIFLSSLYQATL